MKNLNSKFLIALAAITMSVASLRAETFVVDNIYYSTLTDNTVAVDADPADKVEYKGNVVVPAKVTYQGTTYDVTEVAKNCFRLDSELISVTLPASIVKIGNMAFATATALESVNLEVTKITALPYAIFSGCKALKSLTIPASVTSIDGNPVVNNVALTAINVAQGNTVYKSIDGVLYSIDGKCLYAFPPGKSINYIVPDGTEVIYNDAFNTCKLIETVQLPNTLRTIRNTAFGSCSALKSINFPESLDSILSSAFTSCKQLRLDLDLSKVRFLGAGAFTNAGITSIILSSSLKGIGMDMFNGASSLASVTIPEGPTMIGDMAFNNTAITKIVVPNSVTSLGTSVFRSCAALKEIDLGAGITSIGFTSFTGVTPTSVTSRNPNPPKVTVNANYPMFSDAVFQSCRLFVPADAIEAYKAAASWSSFVNISEINTGIVASHIDNKINITTANGTLSISGADSVTIYSLTGTRIYQGHSTNINLPTGNAYIVVADGASFKVML